MLRQQRVDKSTVHASPPDAGVLQCAHEHVASGRPVQQAQQLARQRHHRAAAVRSRTTSSPPPAPNARASRPEAWRTRSGSGTHARMRARARRAPPCLPACNATLRCLTPQRHRAATHQVSRQHRRAVCRLASQPRCQTANGPDGVGRGLPGCGALSPPWAQLSKGPLFPPCELAWVILGSLRTCQGGPHDHQTDGSQVECFSRTLSSRITERVWRGRWRLPFCGAADLISGWC